LEIWNVGLNSIEKKNRGTSSIQLNILILQLTVYNLRAAKNLDLFIFILKKGKKAKKAKKREKSEKSKKSEKKAKK
jgi:hypothetical protein